MKKYVLITAVFTACLALCTAVWSQSKAVKETPVPHHAAAVSAPEPTVVPATSKAETMPPAEKEKVEIPHPEPLHEVIPEPEPVPEDAPPNLDVQSVPETEAEPEPVLISAPAQAVTDPLPGGMFYVPGFGWLESQGEGTVTYAEDIYENGNKVGIMG